MRICFHDEFSYLSTEGGSGVRTGCAQAKSYPSSYINNSSQKSGIIFPLCLSVSFILLPIPLSRTDFHQKLPRVVLLMSENPVPNPDCTDTAVKYHGYSVIKIVQRRECVLKRLFGIHVTVSVDSLSANIKP